MSAVDDAKHMLSFGSLRAMEDANSKIMGSYFWQFVRLVHFGIFILMKVEGKKPFKFLSMRQLILSLVKALELGDH
jgi:hypothetical protein